MNQMIIGKLFTKTLQDHSAEGSPIGAFEIEVTIDQRQFLRSTDKAGLIKKHLAGYAASAIHDTGVPMEMWNCTLDKTVARELNLPSFFSFGAR